MLLLDASGSMGERMPAARAAALDLVRTLRPSDRGALVLFSDSVRIAQALTDDHARLEAAIRDAAPAGGTALHEALYIALRQFTRQRADGEIRRQALVVLSDGEDTTSRNVTEQDVLDIARRSAVTVFTIVPAADIDIDPFARITRAGPGAEFYMRNLARETGGRAFNPSRADDLSGAYRQIADELRQQYWLAYIAPAAGAGFRRLSVQIVNHPEFRARTRSGYFLSAPRVGAKTVTSGGDGP
jgi:Ca-activated chloride channel family protein